MGRNIYRVLSTRIGIEFRRFRMNRVVAHSVPRPVSAPCPDTQFVPIVARLEAERTFRRYEKMTIGLMTVYYSKLNFRFL